MEMTSTRRAFLGGVATLAVWPGSLWGGDRPKMPSRRLAVWETPDAAATDNVMVRRLYLDLAGRIPTAEEARAYVASKDPDKRAALVEKLLSSESFVDYWTMRFCDILRVKSEFPINLWPNAVYVYHSRIRSLVASGETWESFGRSLITAQGSNFRDPEVNFFRATDRRDPDGWAEAVAQTFLGIAPKALDENRRRGLSSYLSNVRIKRTREWKEEIVFVEGEDRRGKLCDRIFTDDREAVASAFVARLREWIFGPSASRPTADRCRTTVLKEAVRSIVLSDEYARGSVTGGFPVRRLDAEILDDIFCSISGSPRNYHSPAPEPYSFLPKDRPTICIEDGSISSGFLSLFARPARDTGLMEERGSDVTAKQRLYLFNSADIHRKLGRIFRKSPGVPGGKADSSVQIPPANRLDEIYWRLLSRAPSDEERGKVAALWRRRRGDGKKKSKTGYGELLRDVAWCLINTKEFIYRV